MDNNSDKDFFANLGEDNEEIFNRRRQRANTEQSFEKGTPARSQSPVSSVDNSRPASYPRVSQSQNSSPAYAQRRGQTNTPPKNLQGTRTPSGVSGAASASSNGKRTNDILNSSNQKKPVASADSAAKSNGASAPFNSRRKDPKTTVTANQPTRMRTISNMGKPLNKENSDELISPKKKKKITSSSKMTPPTSDKSVAPKISTAKGGADIMSNVIRAIIYLVIVFVISAFLSIIAIKIGNDVFAFVKDDVEVTVSIPDKADIGDIAKILKDDGIIKYPSIFKMYAKIKHDDGEFISGDYKISPSMSYDDLRSAFKKQVATGTSWITIPEGYSVDEIINLMVENNIGKRDKYIDVINNYDFDYWFIDDLKNGKIKDGRAYRLEGYLFPDTYEFYNASSEEMVIKKMLNRFEEVFVADYKTKASEMGYSVDEILTIASMIEKEAGRTADYMYVSSVFHNRLKSSGYFPKLDSDATVLYGIQLIKGERPKKCSPDDLNFDSPYNTYLKDGLPPGPITNPSASAIRYALYPADTNYYYFITDNAGIAHFAASSAEHQANIQKIAADNNEE